MTQQNKLNFNNKNIFIIKNGKTGNMGKNEYRKMDKVR